MAGTAQDSQRVVRVDECCHCKKPFHIRSNIDSGDPGTEEIKVNCPYCNEPLLVRVPRSMVPKDGILRGKAAVVET